MSDCPYKAWDEKSEELWRKWEEMMHKHEYRFAPNIEQVSSARTNTYGFYCTVSGCDEYILLPEAERRLNATECLSAEAAEQFGWGQRLSFGPKQQGYKICDMLIAYAEALSDE